MFLKAVLERPLQVTDRLMRLAGAVGNEACDAVRQVAAHRICVGLKREKTNG
jgi:hypothetical protein